MLFWSRSFGPFLVALLVLGTAAVLLAGPLAPPTGPTAGTDGVLNPFLAGQPAKAAEVNHNFKVLAEAVNALQTENAALKQRLDAWESSIKVLPDGRVRISDDLTTAPGRGKLEVRNVPTPAYGASIAAEPDGRALELITADFDYTGNKGSALEFWFGGTGDTYSSIRARRSGKSSAANLVLQFDGGNVGIGTPDPKAKLDVAGEIKGFGVVPIGTIVAWHKSMPNNTTPALPDGWAECNGQTLNDTASLYHNRVIPNLNGENLFLRGNAASGGRGGEKEHVLTVEEMPTHAHNYVVGAGGGGGQITLNAPNNPRELGTSSTGGSRPHNNEPQYMDMVWIMRIK